MTTMKTSQEWWAETKADNAKLTHWLERQYVGEAIAAERIRKFAAAKATEPKHRNILAMIAKQEEDHRDWVKDLLDARGIDTPSLLEGEKRYWAAVKVDEPDWETGCAVGAHAEAMRLERIKVIAEDETAPEDIREVFAKILPEERFHEAAFRAFAGPEAMSNTVDAHQRGLEVLGLEV